MRTKLLLLSSTILLSSCAVKPEPFLLENHMERAAMDRAALFQSAVPIENALSLDEAIARGLLYNLDHHVGMMEEALQDKQLTLANFNMLPRIAANAGYNWRDTERASESISLRTRTRSLEPSFSEERNVRTADLSFSWNILDFGLSYYQAKQQADRVLAAVEKRRRVMNNLVLQIENSYWQALSAQRVLPKVEMLLIDVEKAVAASETIEEEGLQSPLSTLEYRRNLLTVLTQLKKLKSDLLIAKAQLASLINLPQSQEFVLSAPLEVQLPEVATQLEDLQNYGLVYRPELREEAYQERIDRQNINREIIRMFPSLSIIGSANYDSNDLLAFNRWEEVGLRATWNLLNVIQGPKAIETAKLQVEIDQQRRLALSAAILAQISISATQYHQAIDGYSTAQELSDIERKMLKIASDAENAESGTELERIQKSAQAISADLNRDQAYTEARAALSNLLVSIGLDLVPASADNAELENMTAKVRNARDVIENGNLSALLREGMAPRPGKKPIINYNAESEINESHVYIKREKPNFFERLWRGI